MTDNHDEPETPKTPKTPDTEMPIHAKDDSGMPESKDGTRKEENKPM